MNTAVAEKPRAARPSAGIDRRRLLRIVTLLPAAEAMPDAIDASGLLELWTASWQAASRAVELAMGMGAMTSSEGALCKQRIVAERAAVEDELQR